MVDFNRHGLRDTGTRRKEADGEKATTSKRARTGKDMLPPPPRSTSGAGKAGTKTATASAKEKSSKVVKAPAAGGGHTGGPLVPIPAVQSVRDAPVAAWIPPCLDCSW